MPLWLVYIYPLTTQSQVIRCVNAFVSMCLWCAQTILYVPNPAWSLVSVCLHIIPPSVHWSVQRPHQCPQVARQSFTGDAVQRLPLSSICNPDDFSTQCPASPYTKRCTLGKWWFFFRRKWSPGSTAMASWPRSHQCLEIKMSYSLRFWSALKEATLPWY